MLADIGRTSVKKVECASLPLIPFSILLLSLENLIYLCRIQNKLSVLKMVYFQTVKSKTVYVKIYLDICVKFKISLLPIPIAFEDLY